MRGVEFPEDPCWRSRFHGQQTHPVDVSGKTLRTWTRISEAMPKAISKARRDMGILHLKWMVVWGMQTLMYDSSTDSTKTSPTRDT